MCAAALLGETTGEKQPNPQLDLWCRPTIPRHGERDERAAIGGTPFHECALSRFKIRNTVIGFHRPARGPGTFAAYHYSRAKLHEFQRTIDRLSSIIDLSLAGT
jgi:hypothetical protein